MGGQTRDRSARPSSFGLTAFSLQPNRLITAYSLQPAGAQRRHCGGFTLLELLIVIAMMIFITTISLMNYFGAMRTAGYTAVSNDVFNALLMARQRACIDNKPVCFYLTDSNKFVLQEPLGTVAQIKGFTFYDPYVDPAAVSSNMAIVDITTPGASATILLTTNGPLPLMPGVFDVNNIQIFYACSFAVDKPAGWTAGDSYGIAVSPEQMLPKGFVFTQPSSTPCVFATFMPDGTAAASATLQVRETLKNDANHQLSFSVDATGKVSQGQ